MANRIGTFPTFANLAPPWSLPTLDSNFVSVNTFGNDSSLGFMNGILTDTGSANAYAVTCPIGAPSAYNPGFAIAFTPANSNTAGSTITVSPLGSAPILTSSGATLPSGALQAGNSALIVLVGTAFRLFNATYNPLNSVQTVTGAGTFTISCAGFNAVQVFADMSGSAGAYIFNMTGLAAGVPVNMTLLTNGAGKQISVTAANPSSVAYAVRALYQGTSTNLVSGHDTFTNGVVYQGVTYLDNVTSTPTLNFGASYY